MGLHHTLEAALLGLIQGLTEFLPVSSSGHLALVQQWLGWHENPVAFDLVLHFGTLVPVVWFYRRDLWEFGRAALPGGDPQARRLMAELALCTLITAAIGLTFKQQFIDGFSNPIEVPIELAISGVLIYATRWFTDGKRTQMGWWRTAIVGVAQGISAAPGISRSGATITVALMAGVQPAAAARFSFLASIPAIAGAIVLDAGDAVRSPVAGLTPVDLLIGAVVSGVAGYISLVWLVKVVARGRIAGFAWYLWAFAGFSLWLALARGQVP